MPPLNEQIQEDHLLMVSMEDELTGERVFFDTPCLRWLLSNLERILYLETLPEAWDEIASDPEASCPVCFEKYKQPGEEEAIPGSGKASQGKEKPLKLECEHVICIRCLRRIINENYSGEKPRCPLCRHWIDTVINEIPLVRMDGQYDYIGYLCCVIRLYILTNPTKPKTIEGLNEWVHSPTFQGKPLIFARMRVTVEQWGKYGSKRMWEYILARRDGHLPNKEFGFDHGARVLIRTMLNSSTPVLQHTEIFAI